MTIDKYPMTWEQAVQWVKSQPDKLQLVLDCYYDDPILIAAERYCKSSEWAAVTNLLSNYSGRALDIGAGRGMSCYALTKIGFTVTALEPSNSEIVGVGAIERLANEAGLTINVCQENTDNLPFDNNYFDVVFARAVLHHTENLYSACSEILRVLKPGGILISIREHVITNKSDLRKFFDSHPLHHLYGGENAFVLEDYTSAFNQAGFSQIQIITPWKSPLNHNHYDIHLVHKSVSDKFGLLSPLLGFLFKVPIIWTISCRILDAIDNRPGRLYSFTAIKP